MKFMSKNRILLFFLMILIVVNFLDARSNITTGGDKKFDQIKYHNVGNIWLRVSNYGFFGSGDTSPQWPSLEYPGGSGIDYLYQGALWFGAKKVRRSNSGQRLFWANYPPDDENDVISEADPSFDPEVYTHLVVDTLTTVGFDGDADLYEFLPAYNPTEVAPLGTQYNEWNLSDTIMYASIRRNRRGVDDDGDGKIDEDPVGYSFPFRESDELPPEFSEYGGQFPADFLDYSPIVTNLDIWFPLGFVELSDETNTLYNFAARNDDDGDNLKDEDGYPVSEQDFISYYYDYSPFPNGYTGDRDYGSSQGSNKHIPLNVRVRQMSYQWSYDYIKNLSYVEFDISNMNDQDTLYDCAMGIYMDSDVGPQAWGAQARADDDKSAYIATGYEVAYTFDADQDGGLTTGFVGSRVCSPNPDSLEFACWYWTVGNGPDDGDPLNVETRPTANEKYWLLTNRNPRTTSVYTDLRTEDQEEPGDTRYLFAFYGDQLGMESPSSTSWNLAPKKTMKIVIGIFPGNTVNDLRKSATFAKLIYGESQNLEDVVEPDIFPHYQAPEPPQIPKMYVNLNDKGSRIDVYWDNRSQMENVDVKVIAKEQMGWQTMDNTIDSYYDPNNLPEGIPDEFLPTDPPVWNENALVNPWTAYRLRHDFQGYALYGRSGSGSQEQWMHEERWDKVDTQRDYDDYNVNSETPSYLNFGGDDGINEGFPQPKMLTAETENYEFYLNYYRFSDKYSLVHYQEGDYFYGEPIYNYNVDYSDSLANYANLFTKTDKALLFRNPNIDEEVYLALYDESLIPLPDMVGQYAIGDADKLEAMKKNRLSRVYYASSIYNPPKGIEYYVAVTSWDRGMPAVPLDPLESGRDADANMKVVFPGPAATTNMDKIIVVPNPYVGSSKFDGRRENDEKGDKSRRIWFVNLPEQCTIRIYTLAGDLVDTIKHNGANNYQDVVSVSKASYSGKAASSLDTWDLLSKNNQIIASGVYLFSVEAANGDVKVGKFVIIK